MLHGRSGVHRPQCCTAVAGSAFAFNLRGFSAEFHPWNRRARTLIEKLRITGLVVLVTSLAGWRWPAVGSAAGRASACCRRYR